MGKDDSGDLELTSKSSSDNADKGIAQQPKGVSGVDEDRPPTPPKRDFEAEAKAAPRPMVSESRPRSKISSFPRPEFIYKPENTEAAMNCLKNVIIFINLLVWLFGAALMAIGIWIKVDQQFWDLETGLDMKQFTTSAYILIAAGVIIMLIGFVGCYGAFALSMCLLVLYAIVIVVIILLEIAVIGIVFTASKSKGLKEDIKAKARKAMQDMSTNEKQRYFLDLLQSKLKCCGIDSADDYQEHGIPRSCTDTDTGFPYKQGCLTTVLKYLESKASIVGGVTIVVFILQLGALVLTICLACGIKNSASNAVF